MTRTSARSNHVVALLRNAQVLIAGGEQRGDDLTAEIYDPGSGGFTVVLGNMNASPKL